MPGGTTGSPGAPEADKVAGEKDKVSFGVEQVYYVDTTTSDVKRVGGPDPRATLPHGTTLVPVEFELQGDNELLLSVSPGGRSSPERRSPGARPTSAPSRASPMRGGHPTTMTKEELQKLMYNSAQVDGATSWIPYNERNWLSGYGHRTPLSESIAQHNPGAVPEGAPRQGSLAVAGVTVSPTKTPTRPGSAPARKLPHPHKPSMSGGGLAYMNVSSRGIDRHVDVSDRARLAAVGGYYHGVYSSIQAPIGVFRDRERPTSAFGRQTPQYSPHGGGSPQKSPHPHPRPLDIASPSAVGMWNDQSVQRDMENQSAQYFVMDFASQRLVAGGQAGGISAPSPITPKSLMKDAPAAQQVTPVSPGIQDYHPKLSVLGGEAHLPRVEGDGTRGVAPLVKEEERGIFDEENPRTGAYRTRTAFPLMPSTARSPPPSPESSPEPGHLQVVGISPHKIKLPSVHAEDEVEAENSLVFTGIKDGDVTIVSTDTKPVVDMVDGLTESEFVNDIPPQAQAQTPEPPDGALGGHRTPSVTPTQSPVPDLRAYTEEEIDLMCRLQARTRGNLDRKKMRAEKSYMQPVRAHEGEDLPELESFTEEDVDKLKKLQALARGRQARKTISDGEAAGALPAEYDKLPDLTEFSEDDISYLMKIQALARGRQVRQMKMRKGGAPPGGSTASVGSRLTMDDKAAIDDALDDLPDMSSYSEEEVMKLSRMQRRIKEAKLRQKPMNMRPPSAFSDNSVAQLGSECGMDPPRLEDYYNAKDASVIYHDHLIEVTRKQLEDKLMARAYQNFEKKRQEVSHIPIAEGPGDQADQVVPWDPQVDDGINVERSINSSLQSIKFLTEGRRPPVRRPASAKARAGRLMPKTAKMNTGDYSSTFVSAMHPRSRLSGTPFLSPNKMSVTKHLADIQENWHVDVATGVLDSGEHENLSRSLPLLQRPRSAVMTKDQRVRRAAAVNPSVYSRMRNARLTGMVAAGPAGQEEIKSVIRRRLAEARSACVPFMKSKAPKDGNASGAAEGAKTIDGAASPGPTPGQEPVAVQAAAKKSARPASAGVVRPSTKLVRPMSAAARPKEEKKTFRKPYVPKSEWVNREEPTKEDCFVTLHLPKGRDGPGVLAYSKKDPEHHVMVEGIHDYRDPVLRYTIHSERGDSIYHY